MTAHMIPSIPREFEPSSKEGVVFDALKKLPDDYYVFHSVSETVICNSTQYERELDFVIANRKKGILCLEAKAGAYIHYENRTWKYSNGKPMSHGGPYKQIASAKRTLLNKIQCHPDPAVRDLYAKCKILHGVFFMDISKSDFESLPGLPEEADSNITLFAEDILNPTKKINSIFSIDLPAHAYSSQEAKLSEDEFRLLLDSVLCPHFHLIPSARVKGIISEERMNQLLREQYRILDFLEEQESAVISGAAGTGKTMLAVEKARRHSCTGEKVLFLCFNKLLCNYLNDTYKKSGDKAYTRQFANVDFMTISKLAYSAVGNSSDYDGLYAWLCECLSDFSKFGYKHIIIDEGQDFGLIDSELNYHLAEKMADKNCSIIDALQTIAQENHGTFYLFYDKYQMIQGTQKMYYTLPDCIENSDCHLTLHKNCRNTLEIAKTSVTPLRDIKNRMVKYQTACSWEDPIKPHMYIINSNKYVTQVVNRLLNEYDEIDLQDVVLLTTKTAFKSSLAESIEYNQKEGCYTYKYQDKKYPITTCRKFKGLEASAIILLDLNQESFSSREGMQFYVGASRAKQRLDLICCMEERSYPDVIASVAPNAPKTNNTNRMKTIISNAFGVEISVEHFDETDERKEKIAAVI